MIAFSVSFMDWRASTATAAARAASADVAADTVSESSASCTRAPAALSILSLKPSSRP